MRFGIRSLHLREEASMLRDATVQPMLPVKDLDAATRFYEDTLGFERCPMPKWSRSVIGLKP